MTFAISADDPRAASERYSVYEMQPLLSSSNAWRRGVSASETDEHLSMEVSGGHPSGPCPAGMHSHERRRA